MAPTSGNPALATTIEAFSAAPYAVVDGGLFDDLPRLFRQERLFARSLFLDRADDEVQKAGPWLVALSQSPEATARVLSLPARKPFAVFWSCDRGEAILYRHLRSLNMARVPTWAADKGQPRRATTNATETYSTVFFRHYDPRVLAALMPCLDSAQFARVLGPAVQIAFSTPAYGVRNVVAEHQQPPVPIGLLTVRSDQYEEMIERRVEESNERVADYLRSYASANVAHLDDDGLISLVRTHGSQARAFGARNEYSIGLWSYMQVTNKTDLSRNEHVVRFMASPHAGSNPDVRLEALFETRTAALRKVYG